MEIIKTRTELVREAADKLNIVGTDQVLEAAYAAKIDGNVDPLFMQLGADGIVTIANSDHLPAEWFDSLAGLLANISAPVGGKTFDPNIKAYYENQLKRTNSGRPSYSIMSTDYF